MTIKKTLTALAATLLCVALLVSNAVPTSAQVGAPAASPSPVPTPITNQTSAPAQHSNTLLYAIGAIVVIGVVGVVLLNTAANRATGAGGCTKHACAVVGFRLRFGGAR